MSFYHLSAIYFIALALEVFANLTQNNSLQYFSKPSLMLILILYYAFNTRNFPSVKYLIIVALVFSWLGDVILLLDKQYKTLFVYGLIAFLVAHIFYIFYFWRIRKLNFVTKLPNALIFIGIAGYSLALFAYVAPNARNLLIPVAVYALIISIMFAVSFTAFDFSKHDFGKICVAGSLLFLVSDSILAINRFVSPFSLAPVFIMLTYAVAQLLITEGSLRNLRAIEDK